MPTAAAAAGGRGGVASVRRVVPSRLRVIQRDFLTRRGGRTHLIRSSTAVSYAPAYMSAYQGDSSKCPRVIDAEVVHGDEQAFWTARRDFYRGGAASSFYPVWDRQAQALIMLTREVVRIPQEAAFRLFTLGLKMMLLPRVVAGTELLLPSWLTINTEALMAEAGLQKGEEKQDEKDDKAAAAASSDSTAAPSSSSSEKNQ